MTNERRRLAGEVIAAKMEKTVRVRVDRSFRHPVYQKVLKRSKSYLAHDELGVQPGDQVVMVESRPLSKRVRWVIQEVIKPAKPGSSPMAVERPAPKAGKAEEVPPEEGESAQFDSATEGEAAESEVGEES